MKKGVSIGVKTEALMAARIKAGFSLRELGRRTNLSPSFLSQIEKGNRFPGPETAKKITEGLNKDFDDIFFINSVRKSERCKHYTHSPNLGSKTSVQCLRNKHIV